MAPIWALDTNFEYQVGTIESLRTKFLVVEAYGAERFLGMSRVDLFSLATGPCTVELGIKEGSRVNGILSFEASFQQITSMSIQLDRLKISSLSNRGYEGQPNPYLSYGLAASGCDLESAVAASAIAPEWERLPQMHCRGSFNSLQDQRIRCEVKHSRNGFTAGINDQAMSTFDIQLSSLPIEFGRDTSVPFRVMIHSLPNYPHPFSAEVTGLLSIRNLPQVVQMRGGVLTDEGIVGGVSRTKPEMLPTTREPTVDHSYRLVSPARQRPQVFDDRRENGASAVSNSLPSAIVPGTSAGALDVELLTEVSEKQQSLLSTVQERLRQIARRRSEITREASSLKAREETSLEASSRRRHAINADTKAACAEKERLEQLLQTIAIRREQELHQSAQLAAERERARRAIEEEQNEVNMLQERVLQLRAEMTRHLEEEEQRYAQRVREAEEAKRRAQRDADDLAALEAKLSNAEARSRATQRESSYRRHSPIRM